MADALVEDVAIEAPRRLGPFKQFMRHRLAFFGVVIIAILLVGSALAPWLAPFDPDDIDIVNRYAPPASPGHWLGSDDLGRDVLSRLMFAGRISLSVGIAAMLVTVVVGFAVGASAAYHGGWVDAALMQFTDIMLCFPSVFLLLFVAAFVPPNLGSMALMIGLTCWMEIARNHLRADSNPEANRFHRCGADGGRAGMAYHRPSDPAQFDGADFRGGDAEHRQRHSPGELRQLSRLWDPASRGELGQYAHERAERISGGSLAGDFSGIAITLAVACFNFIGDGLRDALDPKVRD